MYLLYICTIFASVILENIYCKNILFVMSFVLHEFQKCGKIF